MHFLKFKYMPMVVASWCCTNMSVYIVATLINDGWRQTETEKCLTKSKSGNVMLFGYGVKAKLQNW